MIDYNVHRVPGSSRWRGQRAILHIVVVRTKETYGVQPPALHMSNNTASAMMAFSVAHNIASGRKFRTPPDTPGTKGTTESTAGKGSRIRRTHAHWHLRTLYTSAFYSVSCIRWHNRAEPLQDTDKSATPEGGGGIEGIPHACPCKGYRACTSINGRTPPQQYQSERQQRQ